MRTIIKTNQQIIWFELMPIGWYTYNKAQCSLHDTQLDKKLDLERMVGLRNSEQSEI